MALRPPAAPSPAPTFLGELGKVFLQVRDTVSLQVAVKLEPGDSLFFQQPSSREQPAAAEHLLQEPAAHWQDTGEGREGGPDVTPQELAVTLKNRPPSGAPKTLAEETLGLRQPRTPRRLSSASPVGRAGGTYLFPAVPGTCPGRGAGPSS